MKKLLFLKLLVLVTCLSSALSATAYDWLVDGIYYNVSGISLEVTYKDTNYNSYSGNVTIPPVIISSSGIPYYVTSIGDHAFYGCNNLTSVSISQPQLGNFSIGDYAFNGCTNLTSVNIPFLTYIIGQYAFNNCARLTSINIPETVTSIGDYAFSNMDALTSLTIPNSVTSLGDFFLGFCDALTTVTFGIGVTEIPIYGLYRCPKLANLTIGGNVTYIGYYAFSQDSMLTEVVIPDKVTTIDSRAFYYCKGITKFTIGKSVTMIGNYALDFHGTTTMYGQDALRAVDIYSNAVNPPTIQSNTFGDFDSSNTLMNPYKRYSVYVHGPYEKSLYAAANYWSNFNTKIYAQQPYDFYTGGIYYNITSSTTAKVVNKYGSLGAFNDGDFSYSGNVTIPNTAYDSYTAKTYNVTAIGENAFCESRAVNKNGAGEMPRNQGDLKSVTVGNNVTTIESNAFKDCTGLTTVTLGTGVTSIGTYAFNNCTALTTIRSNRTTPPTIQSSTFDSNHYSTTKVYVPKSAINSYKAANYWKNFYMILPNDGTELDYALNVPGGNIHFTTGNFPWFVYGNSTRVYAEANLATTPYASSVLTAEVTVTQESIVSFDYRTRTIYGGSLDPCTFAIDGTVKLSTFAIEMNDWSNFTADLPAGTHTLTWTYVPTNPTIGYTNWFAVDNVSITAKPSQTGDVNGDGQVTIADVTALIDSLLSGVEVPLDAADVNGDGSVTIADVTALIDMLLGS